MNSAELKREVKRGLTFTITSDFSCIFSMFICERKFYARTYASKNYATLEINPNLLEILYQKEVLRPLYADREIQQFSSWSLPCFIVFSLSLFIAAAIDPAKLHMSKRTEVVEKYNLLQ